jgi:hypothetical protein
MNNKLLFSATALLSLSCIQAPYSNRGQSQIRREPPHQIAQQHVIAGAHPQGPAACAPAAKADADTVQIALLLDTSSSMDGLINQAKSQLWSIVNDLAKGRREGRPLKLQVALYEYGNSNLTDKMSIRQVLPFTSDLEAISRELFMLSTGGGEEYCGAVLQRSLAELQWSDVTALRFTFVCGNEPFSQGSVDFRQSCPAAKTRGVTINTIHCGTRNEAEAGAWYEGATLGGGICSLINSDSSYQDVPTPLDARLRELNGKLNLTYIPYGSQGEAQQRLQSDNDDSNSKLSMRSYANRACSKTSSLYSNTNWDLVDASSQANFDLGKIPKDQLPEAMRNLTPEQIKAQIEATRIQRQELQVELGKVAREREALVQQLLKEQGKQSLGELETTLLPALHAQAAVHGVEWPKPAAKP